VLLSLRTFPPPYCRRRHGLYCGHSIGATGSTVGEVIVRHLHVRLPNLTELCQRLRSSPSRTHIGNYGVNEDVEAEVHAAGASSRICLYWLLTFTGVDSEWYLDAGGRRWPSPILIHAS
jgi:hypothetical protein